MTAAEHRRRSGKPASSADARSRRGTPPIDPDSASDEPEGAVAVGDGLPEDRAAQAAAAAREARLAEYARWLLPIATVGGALVAGYVQGPPAAVLVLAGGALVAVIAVLWARVRPRVGEAPLTGADAYAIGAPRTDEDQKRAVLRALKDLEFERSVGKISEDDFEALTAKYRAEAKRLLRQIDDDNRPERLKVELLVARRLREEGLLGDAGLPADADATDGDERSRKKRGAAPLRKKRKAEPSADDAPPHAGDGEAQTRACRACGTTNDEDAVFCKKCGSRQTGAAAIAVGGAEPAAAAAGRDTSGGEAERA